MNTCIWHILLTVCLDTQMHQCVSQDIQWFESEKQCRIMRKEYEAILNDGDWKHIEYICKPVKAKYAT